MANRKHNGWVVEMPSSRDGEMCYLMGTRDIERSNFIAFVFSDKRAAEIARDNFISRVNFRAPERMTAGLHSRAKLAKAVTLDTVNRRRRKAGLDKFVRAAKDDNLVIVLSSAVAYNP